MAYRVGALERRLDRIDNLKPDVMQSEIRDVKEDVHQLVDDVAGLRRILVGFIVTFSLGIAMLVAVILTSGTGGP